MAFRWFMLNVKSSRYSVRRVRSSLAMGIMSIIWLFSYTSIYNNKFTMEKGREAAAAATRKTSRRMRKNGARAHTAVHCSMTVDGHDLSCRSATPIDSDDFSAFNCYTNSQMKNRIVTRACVYGGSHTQHICGERRVCALRANSTFSGPNATNKR